MLVFPVLVLGDVTFGVLARLVLEFAADLLELEMMFGYFVSGFGVGGVVMAEIAGVAVVLLGL